MKLLPKGLFKLKLWLKHIVILKQFFETRKKWNFVHLRHTSHSSLGSVTRVFFESLQDLFSISGWQGRFRRPRKNTICSSLSKTFFKKILLILYYHHIIYATVSHLINNTMWTVLRIMPECVKRNLMLLINKSCGCLASTLVISYIFNTFSLLYNPLQNSSYNTDHEVMTIFPRFLKKVIFVIFIFVIAKVNFISDKKAKIINALDYLYRYFFIETGSRF